MSRVLGVDYGSKRVGIALSDGLGMTAKPLEVVARDRAVERIGELVREHTVSKVVVGLPVSLGGDEGEAAASARRLGKEIEDTTGVELDYLDERFTSRMAEDALLESGMRRRRRRETVDKVAAAIILQEYLDRPAGPGNQEIS